MSEKEVKFPFRVEMVETDFGSELGPLRGVGWNVKVIVQTATVEEAHQIGETLAAFLSEINELNERAEQ